MAGMSVTKSWLSVSVCLRTFLSFWHQVTTLAHCGLVTPQYKTYKILINIVSGNDLLFAWHQTFDKPYLNQCWLIVNYTLRNKLKRNFMQNSNTLQWRHNERNNVSIVCSTFGSGADQRKLQRSASLAFVRGIWPVNSPHKRPITRKMFTFDDVIMIFMKKCIWKSVCCKILFRPQCV